MLNLVNESISNILEHLKQRGLCNEDSIDSQLYTLRHKQAFLAMQLELFGCVSKSGILHDTDKVVTYGMMDYDKANELHKKYAKHWIDNVETQEDIRDIIVDMESARFTKPDKPMNAYLTFKTLFKDEYAKYKPTLQELRIDNEVSVDFNFILWNRERKHLSAYFERKNIEEIDRIASNIALYGADEAVRMFYTDSFKGS